MGRVLIGAVCVAVASFGCSKSPTSPGDIAPQDLRNAPASVVIAGKTLTLAVDLWRDFQPITPPDGRPLIATLRIKATDGSPVPAATRADAVWVLFDAQVWNTRSIDERQRSDTTPSYEITVRDGPKWGPGVSVDVVVRLVDVDGRTLLLRAPNQPIIGTF